MGCRAALSRRGEDLPLEEAPLSVVFARGSSRGVAKDTSASNGAAASNTPGTMTPCSNIIQRYLNEGKRVAEGPDRRRRWKRDPKIDDAHLLPRQQRQDDESDGAAYDDTIYADTEENFMNIWEAQNKRPMQLLLRLLLVLLVMHSSKRVYQNVVSPAIRALHGLSGARPDFVYEHPYATSTYYTSTSNTKVLKRIQELQIEPKKNRPLDRERQISRLAIVRPFCEFDANEVQSTFASWNSFVPCRAAEMDLGEEKDEDIDEWVLFDTSVNGTGRKLNNDEAEQWECEDGHDSASGSWFRGVGFARPLFKRCKRKPKAKDFFDDVGSDGLRTTAADLFLFYSQTYSEGEDATQAVDRIMEDFFAPGGWSRCFDNIYAIEGNIPQELDLYIPSAQEELSTWVNGPNRAFEAGFRTIQSGEWGDYDAFYLMEGDSVPVKNYWLDVILGEIGTHRPFAVLGAQYGGDKWDAFYEDLPISLLHHINGNGIYNTSHPLLERLTGQLEIEASCPYNSIPFDYRLSQMWVEGTHGFVPELAPKIILNEEGRNITLSDNQALFSNWANRWEGEEPFKVTKAVHNYAHTNLIPRHLGPEYVVHGARLFSPWDPVRTEITLVVSEWHFDRSLSLIKSLDSKDHPFSKVIILIPPSVSNGHNYEEYTSVPVELQLRDAPDFMDLCSANVETEWFMMTNSYHQVARHVDLMFTPGTFKPVVPYTPATYSHCLKYPFCKEVINLAQRWNPKHKRIVLDQDMLYHTKERDEFCAEWMERNRDEGQDLYAKWQPLRRKLREEKIIGPKGPTGTDYLAWLTREAKEGTLYEMSDRSRYGARSPFVQDHRKEEKLDGTSEEELFRRLGVTLLSNTTECSCGRFNIKNDCLRSGIGCQWRPLFESCHLPEMIDGGAPICGASEPPTMSPGVSIEKLLMETESPTQGAAGDGAEDAEGRTLDAAPDSNRNVLNLMASSDRNSTANVMTHSFDPTSVSDNKSPAAELLESLARGEVAPTESPYQEPAERLCPTWGPSVVPRRLDDLLSSDKDDDSNVSGDGKEVPTSANDTNVDARMRFTNPSWPGRARHTQHQLVQLDPSMSLGPESITVPHPEEAKKRRLLVNYGEELSSLRISFDTSALSSILHEMSKDFSAVERYNPTKARVNAYIDEIFPSIADTWGKVLRIYPSLQNIFPQTSESCGSIPHEHIDEGVANADTVIYVEIREEALCSEDSKPRIAICHFDQNTRPLIGSLSLCLDGMEVEDDKVYDTEILHHTATLSNLVGRFLGLSPSLFRYFRDRETDQLWGERKVGISCGGDGGEMQEVMLSNVIQRRTVRDEEAFYDISTPTVTQVVRNHFDCQTLSGARLDDPLPDSSNNYECAFVNLDLRGHFDEDMTAIGQNADGAYGVTPLSLALLEDSSWYKADFSASTTPAFGRGAGCGFVESACIAGGNVPDYSDGFFCASHDPPGVRSGCDHTHRNKAGCDLESDANPPEGYRYFLPSNPQYGSPFEDVDYCPMRSKHLVPCSSNGVKAAVASLAGESFEESSRCFETDANVPVCLETVCNPSDKTLSVVVNGRTFYCSHHRQVINVDAGYSIVCPRLAVVCPDLVCPSNCSGKGRCDYCREVPACVCDSPFDRTEGCWES